MKRVESGEMYGFKIINIFPESSPNEDWADFADSMSKILKETKTKDKEASNSIN